MMAVMIEECLHDMSVRVSTRVPVGCWESIVDQDGRPINLLDELRRDPTAFRNTDVLAHFERIDRLFALWGR